MKTEQTRISDGVYDQYLIDGVAPLSLTARDIAALRAAKLQKQSQNAPMPKGGLFDELTTKQESLF